MAPKPTLRADLYVEVDSSEVVNALNAIAVGLSPIGLEEFLATGVVDWLQLRARSRFDDEGGEEVGGPWAPLRSATQLIRLALGFGADHPINVRTGELRTFVTENRGTLRGISDGAELAWPTDPTGDVAEKIKVAQQGSKRGENPVYPHGRTVPRPVIGANDVDVLALLVALSQHIERSLSGAGFNVIWE